MNALQDKNQPDVTEQTAVNPFIQSFAVEEDPEFQLRELMREHTDKLTDLHKVSLDRARDDARTVFDASLKARVVDFEEAVKNAVHSQDVSTYVAELRGAVSGAFEQFNAISKNIDGTVKTSEMSRRRERRIGVMFLIMNGGMTVVTLLIYIALGVRLA